MAIISGDRLRAVEAVAGTLRQEALRLEPMGARLIVVREMESERTEGGLYKAPGAVGEMQTGWVVAVGPEVGEQFDQLVEGSEGARLLGLKVLWGRYVGGVVIVEDTDAEYRGRYVCLHENDVWAVDTTWDPTAAVGVNAGTMGSSGDGVSGEAE